MNIAVNTVSQAGIVSDGADVRDRAVRERLAVAEDPH